MPTTTPITISKTLLRAALLLLLAVGLLVAAPLTTATAGGDQARGDYGTGSVCQDIKSDNPPFEPTEPCP